MSHSKIDILENICNMIHYDIPSLDLHHTLKDWYLYNEIK